MNALFITHQKQSGLSLIELLIAMALSLMLMAGVLQIFSANQKSFELTQDLSSLQENAQTALSLMAESIRMADHWGGVLSGKVTFDSSSLSAVAGECNSSWVLRSVPAIMGYDGSASIEAIKNLPSHCIASSDYLKSSDLLVLRYADSKAVLPDSKIDNVRYKKHYFVRTKVGKAAYVFKGANTDQAILNIKADNDVYNRDYQTHLYFLKPCSLKLNKTCQNNIPSLSRLALSGDRLVTQTLVEGVEQLQFFYGVDSNNDHKIDRYLNANEVSDWQRVISVHINLIVRTLEKDPSIDTSGKVIAMTAEVAKQGFSYIASEADKHYRRKYYQREVLLRNRL